MSAYYNDKKILTNVLVYKGTGNIAGITEKVVDGANILEINGYDKDQIQIKNYADIIRVYGGTDFTNNIAIYSGTANVDMYSATINLELYGGTVNATNLKPENIKKGVNILGVIGTYEG